MKRTIAVVTTSRADYSHLRWVLQELDQRPEIDVRLVAMGAHLSERFGGTVEQIRQDGFMIHESIECLLDSDTDVGMAKTIGVATLGLAEVLSRMRPDLLLLIADRYEMLAPASVGMALRIPMAHIEGGEVSEGAIDDAVRNALTKMSHLHFTTTESARKRIEAMGEEKWRIHRVGALSIDNLKKRTLIERPVLESLLDVKLQRPSVLVAYHPVTLDRDTTSESDAVFEALRRIPSQVLFSFPNADAGSRRLIRRAREFSAGLNDSRVFVNLSPLQYWSLMSHV